MATTFEKKFFGKEAEILIAMLKDEMNQKRDPITFRQYDWEFAFYFSSVEGRDVVTMIVRRPY